jgi:hypothetical protein
LWVLSLVDFAANSVLTLKAFLIIFFFTIQFWIHIASLNLRWNLLCHLLSQFKMSVCLMTFWNCCCLQKHKLFVKIFFCFSHVEHICSHIKYLFNSHSSTSPLSASGSHCSALSDKRLVLLFLKSHTNHIREFIILCLSSFTQHAVLKLIFFCCVYQHFTVYYQVVFLCYVAKQVIFIPSLVSGFCYCVCFVFIIVRNFEK